MTTLELAAALGVSPATINRWRKTRGKNCPIEGRKPVWGRMIFSEFDLANLREWMAQPVHRNRGLR